jgi:hypothetical protein
MPRSSLLLLLLTAVLACDDATPLPRTPQS